MRHWKQKSGTVLHNTFYYCPASGKRALVGVTFLSYCSACKVPTNRLISNPSRKIMEELPGRNPTEFLKPIVVFLWTRLLHMIGKLLNMQKIAFSTIFPSYFSPSLSPVFWELINLSKQIAQRNTKRKEATIGAHTCTPTNPRAICTSQTAAALSETPRNRNQTKPVHKHHNLSSKSNIPTTIWKLLELDMHSWDFLLVHSQEKGNLCRTRWKAPTGLAACFGSSQLRYIIISPTYHFLSSFCCDTIPPSEKKQGKQREEDK